DYPLVMPCAKRASKGPQTLRQTNGEETTAAGPPNPDPWFPGPGCPRSRAEPSYGDELYCTVHGPRVHDPLPHHRPTGFCASGDRLSAGALPGRIQIVQALSQQLPQSWRVPRRLHGSDRKEADGAAQAEMVTDWRILVSARWNADRCVLADWTVTERRLG